MSKLKQQLKVVFKSRYVRIALLVAVFLVGLSSGYLFVGATSTSDSFLNLDFIGDLWRTDVDTVSGKVVLSERSCDSSDWNCEAFSVCANTLGDGNGILVANTDLASQYQWKTDIFECQGPQCEEVGGIINLVAYNTVNFSEYPARAQCKAMGGRLPTSSELLCIYNNQASFGDNFSVNEYWSATSTSTPYARAVDFSGGSAVNTDKDISRSVRCVSGW